MSIKQQAINGVLWSAIERFSVQGIQFVLGIIIARLLLPSDYGLIAMLSIFMAIAQTFVDSGFANALIQKKECNAKDFSTVFYFNIVVAIIVYLLLYFLSPYIANFYEEEKLDLITKIVGLTLIINSFGIVQQAKLTIALDFKKLAMASLFAVLISGSIAVIMAYKGYGVWTLVYQSLINNILRVLFTWIFSKWKPILSFSKESFKGLFSFGSKLLLSSLLHTIYTNLYTLVIGKKFAAIELGYYNRAFTMAQFPSTNFTNVVVRAVYPIQCRLQDNDAKLQDTFMKYMRISCFTIFPIMIGLCVLANPLVRLLLTDKWLPIVPMFQIMCIAFMWEPIMKINNTILTVKGRSDYFLYAEILKKVLAIIILFCTIPFGIKVMCMGLILYAFVDMAIIIYYVRKLINIGWITQIKELLPIILLSFSMGGVILLSLHVITVSPLWQLIIGVAIGCTYFITMSLLFKFRELSFLFAAVKSVLKK